LPHTGARAAPDAGGESIVIRSTPPSCRDGGGSAGHAGSSTGTSSAQQ
jgi:hypothetical protein